MKKYRTKSGKVEEKLPGINATVSPSEKVQIAMAGGANTLGDVQTILGQQGKRNNLKGQGAKNILSFDEEDSLESFGLSEGDFAGFSPNAPTGGGYEGMDDPQGRGNIGGFGAPSSFDRSTPTGSGAPDLSSYPPTPGERADARAAEKAKTWALNKASTSYLSSRFDIRERKQEARRASKGYFGDFKEGFDYEWDVLPSRLLPWETAQTSPLDPEKDKVEIAARTKRITEEREKLNIQLDKENEQSLASKAHQAYKENPVKVAIGGFLFNVGALGANVFSAGFSSIVGLGVNLAMNQPKTTEDTAAMEDITPYGSTEKTAAMEDIGSIPTPPPPTTAGSTDTPACPRGSTKSASGICLPITSNNTTLAVVNEKDTRASRKQLRNRPVRYA